MQSGRIPRLHAAAPPVVAFSLASAAALLPHLKCGVAAHAMPPTHQREATNVSLNTERKSGCCSQVSSPLSNGYERLSQAVVSKGDATYLAVTGFKVGTEPSPSAPQPHRCSRRSSQDLGGCR